MAYLFIGLIVGLIMGITGAGGAIISIPLFQLSMNATLKEATVLSLFTVLLGTGSNLLNRLSDVKWKLAFGLFFSGTIANFLTLPLKTLIPESIIAVLLVIIGLYSISSVWSSDFSKKESASETNLGIILLVGLLLGLVTTLTGLGGGVLLIPLLLRVFKMNYEKAIPTSLASILLISLSSLILQLEIALSLIQGIEILYLGAGSLVALVTLRLILNFLSPTQLLKLRKIVFSLATLISLIIVIIKAL